MQLAQAVGDMRKCVIVAMRLLIMCVQSAPYLVGIRARTGPPMSAKPFCKMFFFQPVPQYSFAEYATPLMTASRGLESPPPGTDKPLIFDLSLA